MGSPLESQVLTERQKEIRERQRENACLFPEIRSSPGVKSKDTDQQMLPVGSQSRQTTTPEPEAGFDDYVSSTPTPRRGQLLVMPEHDMTDPPSSPPELRGNPLAAEIRSRSVSHNLLEEWQFSSSPVSGSPNPNRLGVVPDPSSQRGYASVVSLPEVLSSPVKEEYETEPPSTVGEVIEDSMIFEPTGVAPTSKPLDAPADEGPSTPRRSSRLSQRTRETPTTKSDGEEYVDAPTNPQPSTPEQEERFIKAGEVSDGKQPHVVPAGTTSFDISDVDEKSLLRLVVELDSSKADRSEYHQPSPSLSPDGKAPRSPVIDCIVVGDGPQKAEPPLPSRKTRASSAASAVSSSAEAQNIPGSQSKARPGRPKRKRAASKALEADPKRQRHDSTEKSEDETEGSQTAAIQDVVVEVHASAEMPTTIPEDVGKDENPEERIPSSSAEPSSPGSFSQESDSQGPAAAVTEDAMDFEGDDQDVQSQIALEFSQRQMGEESSPASEEAYPALVTAEESMQIDIQHPAANEQEDGGKVADNTADFTTGAEESTAPEKNQVQKMMDLFRGGLDELRSARLSREEVYQIEDMFMDMRRELYEAERRGRA